MFFYGLVLTCFNTIVSISNSYDQRVVDKLLPGSMMIIATRSIAT